MTREDAQAEAVRRWGSGAFADWFTIEGDPPINEFRVGYFAYLGMGSETTHIKGVGANPRTAFADADRRASA